MTGAVGLLQVSSLHPGFLGVTKCRSLSFPNVFWCRQASIPRSLLKGIHASKVQGGLILVKPFDTSLYPENGRRDLPNFNEGRVPEVQSCLLDLATASGPGEG